MSNRDPGATIRRALPVVVALLVALSGAGSATAVSASVTVDVALSDQTKTETLTFRFTPDSNMTVSADESFSRNDGRVTFEFAGWSDLESNADGDQSQWQVVAGHTYRVRYEVTVKNNRVQSTSMCGQTDTYSATAEVQQSNSGATVKQERLETSVTYACPQIGSISQQQVDLVFRQPDSRTVSREIEIPNTGEGAMVPKEVTFSGLPSGFSAKAVDLPDQIASRTSQPFTLEITADSSVSAGTYQFEAVVHDNLGHTERIPVEVQVVKPPVAGVGGTDGEVNLGEVLVGRSTTKSFTVVEVLGSEGISGLSAEVSSAEQNARISFSGLSYLSTQPGGSASAEATVSVSEDARQHETLSWQVELTPDDQQSPTTTVTMRATVIYPAKLGEIEMDNQKLTFDRPRSQVSSHQGRTEVTFENTGDLAMSVQQVTASVDSSDISANVANAPSTVKGLSSGSAVIRYSADADTAEGVYTISVTVQTADAGTKTIERSLRINHVPRLQVERTTVEYGDTIITKSRTRSVDISEHLGYESVRNLQITPVGSSGKYKYISIVQRPPQTLEPGESAPLVFAVQFDAGAELFRQYSWKFRVSGDGVESKVITVRATAKPLNFEQIAQPLKAQTSGSGWQQQVAKGVLTAMNRLESKLRSGEDVPSSDVSTTVALGRATLLFVESASRARQLQSAGNYSGAQSQVLRAVAAYNMMRTYTRELKSNELHSAAKPSVRQASQIVDRLVAQQTDYYRSEHMGSDATVIERARATRALASLAELRGNEQRAKQLRERSNKAFERYISMVKRANQKRQQARELLTKMRENAFITAFGYSAVVNPMRIDTVQDRAATVLSRYGTAEQLLSKAGATQEASEVQAERATAASTLQILKYTAYGSAVGYGIVFLVGIWRLSRNSIAYVRDAEAATTGDFLLE